MVSILDPIVQKQGDTLKSQSWYRSQISNLTDRITAGKLLRDGTLNNRPSGGRLNMFLYDPKTKNRLPYYDVFPLVLPIDTIKGGFLGVNFHYLPPALRLRFLETLQGFANNTKFDRTTRLDASYDDLKKNKFVRPTIKKYLYKQTRSNFLRIDANQAPIAVFLPVAQFRKAGVRTVFRDSRAML
tara:strand:+ start:79 stop:633 length:555 start_codon:yes stop_codon:yes gene_type:complete